MAAGFWLSRSTDTIWAVSVVAFVLVLSTYSVWLLRRAARASGTEVPGSAEATVLITAVLLELGALLTIRLVVAPDPDEPFGAGLTPQALAEGSSALVQPFLGMAAALAVVVLLARCHGTRFGRTRAGRMVANGVRRMTSAAVRPHDGTSSAWTWLLGALLVVALGALFLGPRLTGQPTGSSWLTVWGVATPEYGKIVLLLGLAWVAARDSHAYEELSYKRLIALLRGARAGASRWRRILAFFRTVRFAIYPLTLFLIVAVTSAIRGDLGTLVAAFAGMIGITVAVTGYNVRRAVFGPGPRRYLARFLPAYQLFFLVATAFVIAAGCVLLFTDYAGERRQVWENPWGYRWDAGCVPVAPGATPPQVPTGTVSCLRSLAADAESERSQVARALSAIADGGLWGNGLQDTMAGAVPAGSTDFVTAVMWSKLGGLAVLATAVLVVLLGAALVRTVWRPPLVGSVGPSTATLFGCGLATAIVGQYLFVFAATTNVVPHSGVPAPFLSRGGQSTFALVLGVILVLSLGMAAASPAPDRPVPASGQPARRFAGWWVALPAAPFIAITLGITLVPYSAPAPWTALPTVYGQKRPPCPERADGVSKPPECSTDRVAFARTGIQIRFSDKAGLVQDRRNGGWKVVDAGALGGLAVDDLAGLVQVGQGQVGVLERSYREVVNGWVGADLRRRLSFPSPERVDGWLNLTVNPAWQHRLAQAMRRNDDRGAGPLAGGLVVIDSATGRILAAVSTPPEPVPPAGSVTVSEEEAAAFARAHSGYGRIGPDGSLNDSTSDDSCPRRGGNPDQQRGCWRWSYQETAPVDAAERELRKYVENDAGVELPSPHFNRALGKWYGLGSTFKVVIAAAYLNLPGTHATDLLDAPETIWLSSTRAIHNAGGGPCRGVTADEKLSLTRALAVSCNTAFVALAQRLGWKRIVDQAARFGLTVGACRQEDVPERNAWTMNQLTGAVDGCVPMTTDAVALGNNALGGQGVQGTPLAMASVLAAVANRGVAVRPSLVSAFMPPGAGHPVHTPAAEQQVALSPRAAAELEQALSQTATDGTAAALRDVGTRLWVKTGTHEVVPEGTDLPAGQFVRDISWMTGFLDAPGGRLAFAVAIETRSEAAGAQRVNYLVRELCRTVGGA